MAEIPKELLEEKDFELDENGDVVFKQREYIQHPEGMFEAIIADISKAFVKYYKGTGRIAHRITYITEELLDDGRNMSKHEDITPSFHNKATLRKRWDRIVQEPVPQGRVAMGQVREELLGKTVRLMIEERQSEDGHPYTAVASAKASDNGMAVPDDFVPPETPSYETDDGTDDFPG